MNNSSSLITSPPAREFGQCGKCRIEVAFGARVNDARSADPNCASAENASRACASAVGLSGLTRSAKTVAVGINSCSSSNRFCSRPTAISATPVMLPPGLSRLGISPTSDWIGPHRKDDRNCRRCVFSCQCSRDPNRGHQRHPAIDQIRGQRTQSTVIPFRRVVFDSHRLVSDIAFYLKTLIKGR